MSEVSSLKTRNTAGAKQLAHERSWYFTLAHMIVFPRDPPSAYCSSTLLALPDQAKPLLRLYEWHRRQWLQPCSLIKLKNCTLHTHVYRISMSSKDRHKTKSSEQWKYKVQKQTLYTCDHNMQQRNNHQSMGEAFQWKAVNNPKYT